MSRWHQKGSHRAAGLPLQLLLFACSDVCLHQLSFPFSVFLSQPISLFRPHCVFFYRFPFTSSKESEGLTSISISKPWQQLRKVLSSNQYFLPTRHGAINDDWVYDFTGKKIGANRTEIHGYKTSWFFEIGFTGRPQMLKRSRKILAFTALPLSTDLVTTSPEIRSIWQEFL